MEKNFSYLEYLHNLSIAFEITKDNQAYYREQLIKFKDRNKNIYKDLPKEENENDNKEGKEEKEKKTDKDKFNISFQGCHIAICPNGGLIAICKKKGYLDIAKGSKINKNIIVMHQTTYKIYYIPIDWSYKEHYFILFDFNEKEQLYGICNDAEIYKIDILTERAIHKLTPKILREEKIDKAQFYKDGFIALTGKGRIYYMEEIKNHIPDLIIDINSTLHFSNNIEFLVIPEETSKSKTLELLIFNEKGNGVIHVEKSQEEKSDITPMDDNNINNNIKEQNKICILRKDKLEPYLLEDTNIKSKNKNIKKSKEPQNDIENLGKILAMAISPSKNQIALYDSKGVIYFFNSTLDLDLKKNPRIKSEINLNIELTGKDLQEKEKVITFSKDFQFLFCGEDTVALYGLSLIFLINKASNTIMYKITEEEDEEENNLNNKLYAKLIQEIDGIRYITEDGIFFISKVNKDLFNICSPFSKSPSKKLLKAYLSYIENDPNTERCLSGINNSLSSAVNSLQIAAGNIFWCSYNEEEDEDFGKKDLQLLLLKAAQFGKIYLNENEFNFDKFVENCKDIKCVNNLRNHSKFPRLITFNEYKNMDSKDLIKKLMRNLNFGLAFEICHFLNYSDKKVYHRFAIAKIKKISKNINRDEEEKLAISLIKKLKNVPNLSFIKLAQKAFKYQKNEMGKIFLENEKSALSKIPQYIELKDWNKVLENIENMYDRNVINIVLHKMYVKEGAKNFIQIVSLNSGLKSAVIEFLNERNPEEVENYLTEMKDDEEKLNYFLEKYFVISDLNKRKEILNKARDCLKIIHSSKYPNVEIRFYKNYIENLENNLRMKTNIENMEIILEQNEELSFDSSIYDVYKIILNGKKNDKSFSLEKYKDKYFGISQEGMNMMKLMMLCENNRFDEVSKILKKYINYNKKFSLTNLNVADIYFKFKKYDKAIEYIKNITDPQYINYKINLLIYTDNFDTALEIIFSDKKIKDKGNFLKFILIKKPDLKSKVDELCEKYKVNIECN